MLAASQSHGQSLTVIEGLDDDAIRGLPTAWEVAARIGGPGTERELELGIPNAGNSANIIDEASFNWVSNRLYEWELDYDANLDAGQLIFSVRDTVTGEVFEVTNGAASEGGTPVFDDAFTTLAFRVAAPDNNTGSVAVTVDSFSLDPTGFTSFELFEFDDPGRTEVVLVNGAVGVDDSFVFGGTLVFDNPNDLRRSQLAFQIKGLAGGQVVPEPSTYAAIAGVLALGLAVLRRRMRRR